MTDARPYLEPLLWTLIHKQTLHRQNAVAAGFFPPLGIVGRSRSGLADVGMTIRPLLQCPLFFPVVRRAIAYSDSPSSTEACRAERQDLVSTIQRLLLSQVSRSALALSAALICAVRRDPPYAIALPPYEGGSYLAVAARSALAASPSAAICALSCVEAGELHLRPDEIDQRHAQGLAVEVAREVEQVDLEILLQLADGRTPAEIGDGVAPVAVDQRAHGIDAEARPQMLAQRDVGGGKADGAAALVAQLDRALDLPGMAQQLGGLARPSRGARPRGCGSRNRSRPRASPDRAR